MGKKDTKLSTAAHIKRHTEGTSNEISFSVLDAAKNRADAEVGKDEKNASNFGRVPLFSWSPRKKKSVATPTKDEALSFSGGSSNSSDTSHSRGVVDLGSAPSLSEISRSYTSPEDEIGRRKKRRRSRRMVAALVIVLASIGLVGGGATFLLQEINSHQEQVSLLDQSFERLNEADKTMVPMDVVINQAIDTVSAETLESINGITDRIPGTEQLLDEAEVFAHEASANMRSSSDKEAADQAILAIEARKDMLAQGGILLSAQVQVKNDSEQLTQAWNKILQADVVAREAAALVEDTTKENVAISREKTREALSGFEDAAYLLEGVATSSLSPNIQLLKDYVAKRAESMHYAVASDDAILVDDRQTAEQQNSAYNAADAEASILAADIPADITVIATEAYETYTKQAREQYMQTRLKASTADAFLRDYLGT